MGNHHSSSHAAHKTRKNVHWKSAGRPAVPGKPDIIPILSDEEPNAITLKWAAPAHDGGAPLRGYQVECNRLGAAEWVRTAPPVVLRPELLLTGLEPPHRYQFRVAALNAVGRSDYSELSDVLTVDSDRAPHEPPRFHRHLEDVTALENDKTEFRVAFSGIPHPTIAWFKDDYEIFSSRRTAISTTDSTSVLVFHQTQASDEGEIKCTATNRAGHAVSKARLSLEAAPKLRYPRQYEDGLLYEINETVFLKTTIVGKPTPVVEWRHDGQPVVVDDRIQITNTPKFSMLKIQSAQRSDRGEYQVHAKNNIGEDTAAFLVTVTAPPDPPRNVSVTRQVDKSVTLDWEAPEDDGGCRIGNYVVEYYRVGWNVWLKATTSRKTNVTLFDLIEGSEYRFRVKAESPYGMSSPSAESAPVKIPGRPVDMEFLAIESRIINEELTREVETPVSPAPRRKRAMTATTPGASAPVPLRKQKRSSPPQQATSNEFMLVLYPEHKQADSKAEKRKSFQLDLEDALSPPPISLSAPELSSRCVMPFKILRNAVSSTELLHERAMARFYKAVALKEEQNKLKEDKREKEDRSETNHIPYNNNTNIDQNDQMQEVEMPRIKEDNHKLQAPPIFIKTDSIEENEIKSNQPSRQDSDTSDKWQRMSLSFDEDYTASTVSTDGDYTDEEEEDSLNEDLERSNQLLDEEETYHPRNKTARPSPAKEYPNYEEESDREPIKPLPLPDPNFVPKPILKKREPDPVEMKKAETKNLIQDIESKPKKEDKMTLFKKITKQKPFSFPKKFQKKEVEKSPEQDQILIEKSVKKMDKIEDKFGDEGRTVIDYYGNIVKEYGSIKKPSTPLYLNTEDLKHVAEQQNEETGKENKTVQKEVKKKVVKKPSENKSKTSSKTKKVTSNDRKKQLKQEVDKKIKSENKEISTSSPGKQEINQKLQKSNLDTRVLLKTTERATVVIPIDYKKLEERAKVNVRSAIDYTVDVCLLCLAFWVYFFKDERLAIPFLTLIIFRQLQETITHNIPAWIRRYSPQWLKKKTS